MLELLIALKWPLIAIQLVLSPILIIFVLLQSGKGDDLGSALGGGGGSSSVLGTGGASKVLVKGTVILAIVFMINSIALAKIFKEVETASIGTSVEEPLAPAAGAVDNPKEGESPTEGAPTEEAAPQDIPANE